MRLERFGVGALLALALTAHLRFLHEPLERDEGAYAYVAVRLLAGDVPYRDVFDHKPPGAHFAYATLIAILGPSATAVRLLGALAGVLATAATWLTARRLWGPRAGLFGGALAGALLALPQLQATMANTEILMATPLALHVALSWRAATARSSRLALAAGLVLGVAALFKPVAGTSLPALLVFEAAGRRPGALGRSGLQVLGFGLPWAAALALFASAGAGGDFVRDVLLYNAGYLGGARESALRLVAPLLGTAGGFVLLAVLGAAQALREDGRGPGLLACLWLLGSLGGVMASGRYYPHYFIQALPALAVLGARGLDLLGGRRSLRLPVYLALGLSLGQELRWYARSPEEVSRRKYGTICLDAREMAARLAREVPRGSRVLVWGAEPQIYFLSGTRAPGRFTSVFATHATADAFAGPPPAAVVVASYAPADPRLKRLLGSYALRHTEGELRLFLPAAGEVRTAAAPLPLPLRAPGSGTRPCRRCPPG